MVGWWGVPNGVVAGGATLPAFIEGNDVGAGTDLVVGRTNGDGIGTFVDCGV